MHLISHKLNYSYCPRDYDCVNKTDRSRDTGLRKAFEERASQDTITATVRSTEYCSLVSADLANSTALTL